MTAGLGILGRYRTEAQAVGRQREKALMDLAIAASATLDEDAEVGLNGGQKVFEEIATVLAPDYPPHP